MERGLPVIQQRCQKIMQLDRYDWRKTALIFGEETVETDRHSATMGTIVSASASPNPKMAGANMRNRLNE
jgi:hypothetical protein